MCARQLLHQMKTAEGFVRHIEAVFRSRPNPALMIDQQPKWRGRIQTLGAAHPCNGTRSRVQVCNALHLGTQPKRSVCSGLHTVHRNQSHLLDPFPRVPIAAPGAAHQPRFRAHPHCAIGPGQDLVRKIAGQPVVGGVRLPDLVSRPAHQPSARHAKPDRSLPVLQDSVNHALEPGFSSDPPPVIAAPHHQPSGRRQKNESIGIDGRYAADVIVHRWRVLQFEGIASARKFADTHGATPHPQVAMHVPTDRSPRAGRQAGLDAVHADLFVAQPAQLLAASVPDGMVLRKDSAHCLALHRRRHWNLAAPKLLIWKVLGQFPKAVVRSHVDVPLRVRLQTAGPSHNAIARQGHPREMAAREAEESDLAAHQQVPVRPLGECHARGSGKSFVLPERAETPPVVAEYAPLRAHPEKALLVLIEVFDAEIG